jgi:hypothetical protein
LVIDDIITRVDLAMSLALIVIPNPSASGNGRDAPTPDLPAVIPERGGSTHTGHQLNQLEGATAA